MHGYLYQNLKRSLDLKVIQDGQTQLIGVTPCSMQVLDRLIQQQRSFSQFRVLNRDEIKREFTKPVPPSFPETKSQVKSEYLAKGGIPDRLLRRMLQVPEDEEEWLTTREGFVSAKRVRWNVCDRLVDTVRRYTVWAIHDFL